MPKLVWKKMLPKNSRLLVQSIPCGGLTQITRHPDKEFFRLLGPQRQRHSRSLPAKLCYKCLWAFENSLWNWTYITKVIRELKSKKAPGGDLITTKIIIELPLLCYWGHLQPLQWNRKARLLLKWMKKNYYHDDTVISPFRYLMGGYGCMAPTFGGTRAPTRSIKDSANC